MTFFLSKCVRLDGMVLTVNNNVLDTVETALCVTRWLAAVTLAVLLDGTVYIVIKVSSDGIP